ncbi:MAG TPA: hypoxanthine phosphoribosyltransferase [Thermoanaerobaculia bacterium]|nr:hypoxanthine phosphoribosyltransferase [Thermoanaerobaculia bacterium]
MKARTLIDEARIQRRVEELGAQISADFHGEELIVLCVLKGGIFFTADLVRAMSIDVALDFIQVSSYGNEKYSSGVVTILKEPQLDMRGRPVLITEDIIDSGLSMREVHHYIESRGASRVRVVTLLDKPVSRKVEFRADYVGFTIEPQFVVGYGLDYAERYRNLREIQVLDD